jgi:hypothetical protein
VGGCKRASFLLSGVSLNEFTSFIPGMVGWGKNFFIENRAGGKWIYVFFKEVKNELNCFVIKVGLREENRWRWGEVFTACLEPEKEYLRLSIRRVRGVGRIGSDLVGYWIIDNLRELYPDVSLEGSVIF